MADTANEMKVDIYFAFLKLCFDNVYMHSVALLSKI